MSEPTSATGSVVETKVVASSGVLIFSGLVSWFLVTYIPAFRGGIPVTLQPFVPVVAAWILSTAAGYFAPHTGRPDLLPPAPPAVTPTEGEQSAAG